MKLIFVRPQEGLRVLDERTGQPIPVAGAELPDTPYVRRRLIQGDLVDTPIPAANPAITKKQEG